MGQAEQDNRANQMNPNNDAYWQSRGEDERPDDWEDRPSTSSWLINRPTWVHREIADRDDD